MAYKFEIIGSSIVVTNTILGNIIIENPKRDTFFESSVLSEEKNIQLYNTQGVKSKGYMLYDKLPINESQDSNEVFFTESTFREFARESLGISSGSSSSSGSNVNTSFVNKPYSSTMNITYDSQNPNFEIHLTGNLNLTIDGTVNGDFGILNLYFSASETATLNGYESMSLTGKGNMIPVYFIHDSDGLKWYKGNFDLTPYAKQDGSILYHTYSYISEGTISNTGINVVGTETSFAPSHVGSKIVKSNGESAIIATVTDATHITTIEPFKTNSTDSAYTTRHVAIEINPNGSIIQYSNVGDIIISTDQNGNVGINQNIFKQNGDIETVGSFKNSGTELYNGDVKLSPSGALISSAGGNNPNDIGIRRNGPGVYEINDSTAEAYRDLKLRTLIVTKTRYASTADAIADSTLPSMSFYSITTDEIVRIKP